MAKMGKVVHLSRSGRSRSTDFGGPGLDASAANLVRRLGKRSEGAPRVLRSCGSADRLKPGTSRLERLDTDSAVDRKVRVLGGGSTERDVRYKRRAQVLLYQAASLLAEVEGSEQRLAWLLEDCADLLVREEVREEPLGPVA
ncbi:MAG: hypothetical protein RL417_530 [Pseudomonadota bacterium]